MEYVKLDDYTNEFSGLYRDGWLMVLETENVMLIEQAEETDFGNFEIWRH